MQSTKTQPDISIIFEDKHLLIINKPAGMLSQADHTGDVDVVALCKQYLAQSSKNSPYVGLLHRLDRPVGGLMMLAKTRRAAKDISRQMRDRLVQKTYHAVVQGQPPVNGVLTHYVVKNNETNIVQTVDKNETNGKKALLSFSTIGKNEDLSLLSVHLQTGRSHQIRVQLAAEGYPIWGDYKYGRNQPDGRAMALQAIELVFNHPETQKEKRFKLPHPKNHPWNTFL